MFFVIRIYYGGAVFGIRISDWLFLTTLFSSLYFGTGKRKMEIINNKNSTRTVLKYYNEEYLQSLLNIFLSLIIICYSLWIINEAFTINFNSVILKISIVELVFLLLKYHLNMYSNEFGESPVTIVLKDKVITILALIFCITILLAIII